MEEKWTKKERKGTVQGEGEKREKDKGKEMEKEKRIKEMKWKRRGAKKKGKDDRHE